MTEQDSEDELRTVETDLTPDVYDLKLGRGLFEHVSVDESQAVLELRMTDNQVDDLIGYLEEMRK